MNDALNKFKAEMEKRGLFRKITVAANLIPPRPALTRKPDCHSQAGRKEALIMYAQKHDDSVTFWLKRPLITCLTPSLRMICSSRLGGSHLLTEERAKMEEAEENR